MRIEYNPEISLGSVVQVISILGSVFTAYIALKTTDVEMQSRIDHHSAQIQEMKDNQKQDAAKLDLQLREFGVNIKTLDARITQFMIEQARDYNGNKPNARPIR